jgi:hypothetical protein
MDLTPVELHDGLWVKREDLYRGRFGVNGAKYRACQFLVDRAHDRGATQVVSAASVLSPQSAMAAVVAGEFGMSCRVIVGGTTPDKAVKHKSIGLAQAAGASIEAIPVGYNPALQSAARRAVEDDLTGTSWRLPYGITTDDDVERFLQVGAPQTMNLPDEIETLVIPFGSGNTAAAVLYGLHDFRPANLRKVVLVGIGPDRVDWLNDRLASVGRDNVPPGVELVHISLHGWFASYGDRMPETLDGIVLHPTYEGKVVRFMNSAKPDYWTRRDGKTCFWIVGGPLP